MTNNNVGKKILWPNNPDILIRAVFLYVGQGSSVLLFILGPAMIEGVEDSVEIAVSLFYPIGDLTVQFFAGLIFLKFSEGAEIRRSYGLIIVSFIITAIGDILYAVAESLWWLEAEEASIYGWYGFDLADSLFIWGYALLIIGGLTYYYLISKVLSE